MLAHALTTLRLLLVPPVALALANPPQVAAWLPLLMIAVAIVTDIADGKVARARGTASAAGQLFDHTTDCLFVTAALAGAAWAGMLTPWLPLLVPLAFAQYVVDSRWLHRQKRLRMSSIGRWNGVLYFAPPLLLSMAMIAPELPAMWIRQMVYWGGWLLVISTLASMVDRALAKP